MFARWALPGAVALSLALVPGPAWSKPGRSTKGSSERQPSSAELSGARQKFQKALSLQTAGDWAGARALLGEVAEIRSTPQVLFNIALCEENLGQLVSAIGTYELAIADARQANIHHVETEAAARLERLRARVPHLRIERGQGAERATITLDGIELGEAALSKEVPVDPGAREIRAELPGRSDFLRQVRLDEGQRLVVTVEFEALPQEPPPPVQPIEDSSTQRTLTYISGGVGLVALAASGVFFALRHDTIQDLDALCPSRSSCPAEGRELHERGRTYTTYGNIGLGIGAVGVAAAALLWLTDDSPRHQPSETARSRLILGHPSATWGASWFGTF